MIIGIEVNFDELQINVLKGNVAVYKGLFLELPSGHMIIITIYRTCSIIRPPRINAPSSGAKLLHRVFIS